MLKLRVLIKNFYVLYIEHMIKIPSQLVSVNMFKRINFHLNFISQYNLTFDILFMQKTSCATILITVAQEVQLLLINNYCPYRLILSLTVYTDLQAVVANGAACVWHECVKKVVTVIKQGDSFLRIIV